jgi:hypothetical protein
VVFQIGEVSHSVEHAHRPITRPCHPPTDVALTAGLGGLLSPAGSLIDDAHLFTDVTSLF